MTAGARISKRKVFIATFRKGGGWYNTTAFVVAKDVAHASDILESIHEGMDLRSIEKYPGMVYLDQ